MIRRAIVIALLLFIACSPVPNRDRWLSMPQTEKTLYVKSLLGAEKVKEAKGGNQRHYSLTAEEYVKRIDDAYARGDRRDPREIFATLAGKPVILRRVDGEGSPVSGRDCSKLGGIPRRLRGAE